MPKDKSMSASDQHETHHHVALEYPCCSPPSFCALKFQFAMPLYYQAK